MTITTKATPFPALPHYHHNQLLDHDGTNLLTATPDHGATLSSSTAPFSAYDPETQPAKKTAESADSLGSRYVAAVRSFVRSSAYGLHDLNSPPLPCPGLFPTHKGTAASLPSAAASARTAATPIYY